MRHKPVVCDVSCLGGLGRNRKKRCEPQKTKPGETDFKRLLHELLQKSSHEKSSSNHRQNAPSAAQARQKMYEKFGRLMRTCNTSGVVEHGDFGFSGIDRF
jgi:hypothetical protein